MRQRLFRHGIVVLLLAGAAVGAAGAAQAQLGLPGVGPAVGGAVERLRGTLDDAASLAAGPLESVGADLRALADIRLDRLNQFVRRNRATVAMDANGAPARAHEVLLLDPDPAALTLAEKSGYRLMEQGDLNGLGVGFARLETPVDLALPEATRALQKLLPGKTITADQIHFPNGRDVGGAGAPAGPATKTGTVGLIDGGIKPGPRVSAQAGFAGGAPRPNEHAQSIASLLAGAGVARLYAADVYGDDPAGGNALAIAKALGWMAAQRVAVVSISLVGPANPLLARAVAAAQARGMFVVAAVGNDGAASPLSFPASYDGVIAVTGVDGRGRPLFEAGRASHLDYAAPGADMTAIGLDGRTHGLRGTSFAAPLVAARLAAYPGLGRTAALSALDHEAVAGGARTGRGIVCNLCRKGI